MDNKCLAKKPNPKPIEPKALLLKQIQEGGLPISEVPALVCAPGSRHWFFNVRIGERILVNYEDPDRTEGQFLRDQEKVNEAQIKGFVVIQVNIGTLRDRSAVDQIQRAYQRELKATNEKTEAKKRIDELLRLAHGFSKKLETLTT